MLYNYVFGIMIALTNEKEREKKFSIIKYLKERIENNQNIKPKYNIFSNIASSEIVYV